MLFERRICMIAKYWKKVGLIILIIACLFNIVNKLVKKTSLKEDLTATGQYMLEQQKEKNKKLLK